MEVIKPGTKFNFVGYMPHAVIFSTVLALLAFVGFFVWPGVNWGVDLLGGAEIQVSFTKPVDINKLRDAVDSLNLGNVKVQQWLDVTGKSANRYLIRVKKREGEAAAPAPQAGATAPAGAQAVSTTGQSAILVEKKLGEVFGKDNFKILKSDDVGGRVEELRSGAIMAVILAILLIMVYVAVRFEFKFAIGAVMSLLHDAVICSGVVVWFHKDFDLTIIAAVLTLVGYSVNDTIVVFDRIRENLRRQRRLTLRELINASVNETLSRTILTSFVTWLAVVFLWVIGGPVINGFSFTMLFGIVFGTYSSIFVASAFVIFWDDFRAKKRSPVMIEQK